MTQTQKTPASPSKPPAPPPQQGRKLLDQVMDTIRLKHYSERTGKTYVHWITKYILFHNKRHPKEMGFPEVEAFQTHLAKDQKLSASSQNQALSAVLFLYRHVLKIELQGSTNSIRANKPEHVPAVMTKDEVQRVLKRLSGVSLLMAQVMYGSGIRVSECVQLRVKDLDMEYLTITVHDGKGEKDRVTILPASLVEPLQAHLLKVQQIHNRDLEHGFGQVGLPYALARKSQVHTYTRNTPIPNYQSPITNHHLPLTPCTSNASPSPTSAISPAWTWTCHGGLFCWWATTRRARPVFSKPSTFSRR